MINNFIESLKYSPKRDNVFNPWWETDSENDIDDKGPIIRRQQLFQYLNERIGKAKFLLVGEAIGYQGGHFTGIPMTSERILLGGHVEKGILPEHVFSGIEINRTSKPKLKRQGFTEPTGTIVWGHIIQSNLNPKDFILWNAFPWHPFKPESGYLSNRTPTVSEFHAGTHILTQLIQITKIGNIIAVGEKSLKMLNKLEINCIKVRHPANGGATKYRKQLTKIIS